MFTVFLYYGHKEAYMSQDEKLIKILEDILRFNTLLPDPAFSAREVLDGIQEECTIKPKHALRQLFGKLNPKLQPISNWDPRRQ